MSYADARDALSDYLPQAVREPLKVPDAPIAAPEPVAWRDANPGEIRRIKGEWGPANPARHQGELPQRPAPLHREDPQVAATRLRPGSARSAASCLSCVVPDRNWRPGGGRTILAEHPEAVAARPMARLTLVRLQLQDALEKPAGLDRNLSDAQAAGILEMLSATLKQRPPIEGAYLLEARVLRHLGRGPTGPELACLNEGARFFPRNSQLAIDCVSWDLRAGDVAGARPLIEFALWESSDPSAKGKTLTPGQPGQGRCAGSR